MKVPVNLNGGVNEKTLLIKSNKRMGKGTRE